MKRFLTLSTSLLIVLVGCSTSGAMALETGNAKTALVTTNASLKMEMAVQNVADKHSSLHLKQLLHTVKMAHNATQIASMVKRVKKYAGHTWYVSSGASPSGWDCSGLVTWAYARIGIDLYHSASVQKHSGKIVKEPKVGDIVAFGWRGWSGAQHTGIYLGDGKMLHAGGHRGMRTEVVSISKWAKGSGNTLITYTRILNN